MGFLGKNNLSEEAKTAFWEEYKHTAHKALNVKRSNIAGQLRKQFVGKSNFNAKMKSCLNSLTIFFGLEYCKKLMEEDGSTLAFPDLEKIQKGRKDEKTWIDMIIKFLQYIIPETRVYTTKKPLTKWCPIAAEALLFLMVENSYEVWMEEAEKEKNDNSSPTKRAKYTEKRGSGRRFGGWGNDGIKRFNDLYNDIQKQRRSSTLGSTLEKKLMETASVIGFTEKKRKRQYIEDGVEPKYDMPSEFNSL